MTSTVDSHPTFKGKSVVLKPVSLGHVTQTYLDWLQDDEVMEGIATSGYSFGKLFDYVKQRVNRKDVVFYAIHSAENDKHIGNVKLDFHDAKAMVSELGLLIGDKSYWGKGIGTEACQLIMKYGFDGLKLRKIYLAVYESNPFAKKLYEKLGFKVEGILRKHISIKGQYYDKYLMGIFREEFT